MTFLRRA